MDSDAFLVLWTLAGLVGTAIMWRKGYLAEYIGCVILAGALSSLLPLLLGGGILLIGLSLRNEHEQTSAATETEEQPDVATPKGCAEASRRAGAEAVKVPIG